MNTMKIPITVNDIEGAIEEYLNCNWNKEERRWNDPTKIEAHKLVIQELKQAMVNLEQQNFVEKYKTEKIDDISILTRLNKIYPLIRRREKFDALVKNKIIKLELKDGSLFSFSQPIELETKIAFCDCGMFPKPLDQMIEAELNLANDHILSCPNPKIEIEKHFSSPAKHKVGSWECKACYKEPNDKGNSTIEWCPRFLRPFRQMEVDKYFAVANSGCYAGLFHSQISLFSKDGNDFIERIKMCDTCGYKETNSKQLLS